MKKILFVNNLDLPGKRWNGFDLMKNLNKGNEFSAKQIIIDKQSNDINVKTFFKTYEEKDKFYKMLEFEDEKLSIHSCFSLTSPALEQSEFFKEADLVHYHLLHDSRISLYSLLNLCGKKKSVFTIHDPWFFTGRCVHFDDCDGWKTGCRNCPNLNSIYKMKEDNCNDLWNLKNKVYHSINADLIVTTPYMYELAKTSPLTKDFKHIHLIPLGIDLKKFNNNISKKKARRKFGINENDIVLFLRAQDAFKGTEYVLEALKKLNIDKKITVITCHTKHLLDEVKDKYRVIDLGFLNTKDLLYAYNACDIFLMPSTGESFGFMAVEAMACHKPVIVFNNTALPYVTGAPEIGYLVKNKNSNELKKAIEFLVSNESERIIRGEKGRKYVEEHFDINVTNQKLIEVYNEIINRKKENKKRHIIEDNHEYDNLIKYKLNELTASTYEPSQAEYKKLYYNSVKIANNKKIDYSNLNVQKIIDDYNNEMYRIQSEKNNRILKDYNDLNIYMKVKHIIYCFREDKIRLKTIFSLKLDKHPKLDKFIRSIYKKAKRSN